MEIVIVSSIYSSSDRSKDLTIIVFSNTGNFRITNTVVLGVQQMMFPRTMGNFIPLVIKTVGNRILEILSYNHQLEFIYYSKTADVKKQKD